MSLFAIRLKNVRKERKMTQVDLKEKTGISTANICNFEAYLRYQGAKT